MSKGRSPDLWVLAGILAAGALVRGLYLNEIRSNPDFASPAVDAGFHHYWASALATGDWTPPHNNPDPGISNTPYLRPPGYPYFLSLIYVLAGPGFIGPRVVQMGLGLLNCALAFVIGRRWYGRSVGLIWAGFMSLYWAFIYFEGELHATVLLIFLLLSMVYLLGRWTERMALPYAVFAGGLTGLAALVRPNALLLLLVVPVWMLVAAQRRGLGRKGVVAPCALILGAIAVVSPATIRNYLVARDFVLISANGGVNLFIGNNEDATGVCATDIPGIGRFHTCFDYPALVASLERKEGRPLEYSEVSSYFRDRAAFFIKNKPTAFLRLTLRKALLFWGPTEIGHNKELHYERRFSNVLSRLPGDFPTVLATALAGGVMFFIISRRRRRGGQPETDAWERHPEISVLMILVILTLFFSVLPFFVAGRYRVPVIPFLLAFAAYGTCSVVRFAVARRWQRAVCWVSACAVGCFILRWPGLSIEPDLARWHYEQGASYERVRDHERAMDEYSKAIEIVPDEPTWLLAAAHLLRRTGRLEEAAGHLRRVLALRHVQSCIADAHLALARVSAQQGRTDQAVVHYRESLRADPDAVAVRMELAAFLRKSGRVEEAINECELVVTIDPHNVEALFGMGLMLREAGREDESNRRLLEAVRLDPNRSVLLKAMGIHLAAERPTAQGARSQSPQAQSVDELDRRADRFAQVGRADEAASLYRQALSLEPNHPMIHFKLGNTLSAVERFDEAVVHYRRAIEANPQFAQAHNALGMAYGRLNDAQSAARHYREAVRIDPDMYAAHYNLGIVLGDGLGRYEEAIDALSKALALVESIGRVDLAERISNRIEGFRRKHSAQPDD